MPRTTITRGFVLHVTLILLVALTANGAASAPPKLKASASKGSPGDILEVRGRGFAPSSIVQLELVSDSPDIKKAFLDRLAI
jgi:hypothetical protein